jgi:hypothetical protein
MAPPGSVLRRGNNARRFLAGHPNAGVFAIVGNAGIPFLEKARLG